VSAEAGSNRFCSTCSHGCRPHRESLVLYCVKGPLPKHHDKAGRISLYYGYLHPAAFPALLRELRTAGSCRKRSVVPVGSRGTTSGGGSELLTIIGPAIVSPQRLKKVTNLQFATGPVWAQNPDSQPSKADLSLKKSRASQALFFGKISQGLQ